MLDETDHLLFHAAPDFITVEVTALEGRRLAYGKDLQRTQDSPMCRLRRDGSRIVREDFWPGPGDRGLPVMLAGGEVGKLEDWRHSEAKKEWRWRVAFYNSPRSSDRDTMRR